ncbi:MAG: hypothetical protein WB392_09675 [Methanotrichaceae archaeon]
MTILDQLGRNQSDPLFPYAYNMLACNRKVVELRRRQFTETAGLSVEGCRGAEARVVITDMPLFDELAQEIAMLTDRADRISKMFVALDGVVNRLDNLKMFYTPHKMHEAIGVRKHLIYDYESGLKVRAAKLMGLDTFEPPQAGPENIAEIMKDEIADTKARIKGLQGEIDLLTIALSECNHVIREAGSDLLEPAEPVEVEPLPQLVPGEGARVAFTSSYTDAYGQTHQLFPNRSDEESETVS